MAVVQEEAFVLSLRNWGEADKMATLFTRGQGKVEVAAFGCRRQRSSLAAPMQMFNLLEAHLLTGRRVFTLRKADILRHYRFVTDFQAVAYASFIAEVALRFLPENQPSPRMFDKLLHIFPALETKNPRIVALIAAYQIIDWAGLSLALEQCQRTHVPLNGDVWLIFREGGAVCAEARLADDEALPLTEATRQFIKTLRAYAWTEDAKLEVTRERLVEAEEILLRYLRYLLGRPLRSVAFLSQIAVLPHSISS